MRDWRESEERKQWPASSKIVGLIHTKLGGREYMGLAISAIRSFVRPIGLWLRVSCHHDRRLARFDPIAHASPLPTLLQGLGQTQKPRETRYNTLLAL